MIREKKNEFVITSSEIFEITLNKLSLKKKVYVQTRLRKFFLLLVFFLKDSKIHLKCLNWWSKLKIFLKTIYSFNHKYIHNRKLSY